MCEEQCSYSQIPVNDTGRKQNYKIFSEMSKIFQQDTAKNEVKPKNVSISGIFAGIGTGLSLPIAEFHSTSNPVFGILGRIEYSSTTIFPVVIGSEISYFSYSGIDNYLTQNYLTSFQTKILSFGLTAEVSLSRFLKSYYTIPFICLDVKTNSIKRVISGSSTLPDVPLKESRISIGAGLGFTLFVLDFYVKYNYMKNLSSFGVFTKIKFPVLRF